MHFRRVSISCNHLHRSPFSPDDVREDAEPDTVFTIVDKEHHDLWLAKKSKQ